MQTSAMNADDNLVIPDWLKPAIGTPIVHAPIEEPYSDYPLNPSLALTRLPAHPKTKEERELVTATYEKVFYLSLDKIRGGESLRFLAKSDPRRINVGRFMQWVKSDPTRRRMFDEAQACAAEIFMSEVNEISDGGAEDSDGIPAEVTRDKLRIETRMKLAAFYDPKKYGDVKRVEMTTKDVTEDNLKTMSMEELQKLVIQGEYTTVTDTPTGDPA